MHYKVNSCSDVNELVLNGTDRFWQNAELADIAFFRPESESTFPETKLKLLYSTSGIYGLFMISDRNLRAVHTDHNALVYEDSCVEFFVKPEGAAGYFNFEFNCIGTLYASYITDHERTADGFKEFVKLPMADTGELKITSSLGSDPFEFIEGEASWTLAFYIPFELLSKYSGCSKARPPHLLCRYQSRFHQF